jgi:hypothetical protein
MHMIASIIVQDPKMDLVKFRKLSNVLRADVFNYDNPATLVKAPVDVIMNNGDIGRRGVVFLFFVHHGYFNVGSGLKTELHGRLIGQPITIEPDSNSLIRCTVAAYGLEEAAEDHEAKPILYWGNSIDPAQNILHSLSRKESYLKAQFKQVSKLIRKITTNKK